MRPLLKPASLPHDPRIGFPADHVMEEIGTYCSLCERFLAEDGPLWNKRDDVLVAAVTHETFGDLLVLCVNCAEWQQQTAGDRRELLLPDEATTFRVERSPYTYSLERVVTTIVDDDGAAIGEPYETEAAIVSGTGERAQNTIERFRLNTPWYDAAAKTLRIPARARATLADRRLDLRTEAWRRAEEVVPRLLELGDAHRGIHTKLRLFAEAGGFWSVWVTVLWNATRDREQVASVFSTRPRGLMVAPTELAGLAGGEQATPLRGTSPSFLD
jgi:hypothetical protein